MALRLHINYKDCNHLMKFAWIINNNNTSNLCAEAIRLINFNFNSNNNSSKMQIN